MFYIRRHFNSACWNNNYKLGLSYRESLTSLCSHVRAHAVCRGEVVGIDQLPRSRPQVWQLSPVGPGTDHFLHLKMRNAMMAEDKKQRLSFP